MSERLERVTGLEVHEHCFISGKRARVASRAVYAFEHSHEGGDKPHKHADTGPASYMIDKDDWARTTGLKGGGRKKFTAKPAGEQYPIAELEDWQKSFEVYVDEESCQRVLAGTQATGAGVGPLARMVLGFKMEAVFPDGERRPPRKRAAR